MIFTFFFSDICHQVLDLYSQANNTKPPDSPPLTPSNEPCRDRTITAPPTESASTTPNGIYNKKIIFYYYNKIIRVLSKCKIALLKK